MLKRGQDSRDFILPRIKTKFNNSQHSLYSNSRQINEAERVLRKIEPVNHKMGYMMNKNMDINALEHLEFLTRLESKLVGRGKDYK